ncbi:hypothetical protein LZC95_19745 [Pendulispora brunnea]|uniref:Uncharacterized protein n=1 Tax=Pendulispora brunnea TaxID=2905690 RepID=A0ABZ2KK39_9BACT
MSAVRVLHAMQLANVVVGVPRARWDRAFNVLAALSTANVFAYRFERNDRKALPVTVAELEAAVGRCRPLVLEQGNRTLDGVEEWTTTSDGHPFLHARRAREVSMLRWAFARMQRTKVRLSARELAWIARAATSDSPGLMDRLAALSRANVAALQKARIRGVRWDAAAHAAPEAIFAALRHVEADALFAHFLLDVFRANVCEVDVDAVEAFRALLPPRESVHTPAPPEFEATPMTMASSEESNPA